MVKIVVIDNGEDVGTDWSFDVYLGDKTSERLAAQIQRTYNLRNSKMPYHDENPPQESRKVTVQGDTLVIRVEARRIRTGGAIFGKQEISLKDDLDRIPVPVYSPTPTGSGRSIGQFNVIISIREMINSKTFPPIRPEND